MGIVDVDGLTKKYELERGAGVVVGLEDVSFTVDEGEVLGVIGKMGLVSRLYFGYCVVWNLLMLVGLWLTVLC